MKHKTCYLMLFCFLMTWCLLHCSAQSVITYPAPEGIQASEDYDVFVNGKPVFCYTTWVYDTRFTEKELHYTRKYHGRKDKLMVSTVSFAYFDFEGQVTVNVHVKNRDVFHKATIRPLRAGIDAKVEGSSILFTIDKPVNLTIEPGGSEHRVLHLFAEHPDRDKPSKGVENVLYFGPGIHELPPLDLKSGQTLYIDGGAYVYFVAGKGDTEFGGGNRITATDAEHIRITGRGIIDGIRFPNENYERRGSIRFTGCRNVTVEGIKLISSSSWNMTFVQSRNVNVDGLKIISHFFNSDGINILSCDSVRIKNCFLRQMDDGIITKAIDKESTLKKTTDVIVEHCVLWSDWGYALGAPYKIQCPVEHVIFRNCDIIHATHATEKQGALGVLVSDKGTVSDMLFENINIERSLKPIIKLDIHQTGWTKNKNFGSIRNIRFRNIQYMQGERRPIILAGYSKNSIVEDVVFEDITCLGNPIKSINEWDIRINEFVKNISFK